MPILRRRGYDTVRNDKLSRDGKRRGIETLSLRWKSTTLRASAMPFVRTATKKNGKGENYMKNQINLLHQRAKRFLDNGSITESHFAGYEHALRDMEFADPAFGIDLLEELNLISDKLNAHLYVVLDAQDEEEDEESEEYWRALGAERAYRIALSLIDKVFEKIGDAAYHQVLQKGEQND